MGHAKMLIVIKGRKAEQSALQKGKPTDPAQQVDTTWTLSVYMFILFQVPESPLPFHVSGKHLMRSEPQRKKSPKLSNWEPRALLLVASA